MGLSFPVEADSGLRGVTRILGAEFDTTGILGVSDGEARAFPAALTIPSKTSLATGRIIHFFFAWVLVGTLALWLVASALNGHLRQPAFTLFRADGEKNPIQSAEGNVNPFCGCATSRLSKGNIRHDRICT